MKCCSPQGIPLRATIFDPTTHSTGFSGDFDTCYSIQCNGIRWTTGYLIPTSIDIRNIINSDRKGKNIDTINRTSIILEVDGKNIETGITFIS